MNSISRKPFFGFKLEVPHRFRSLEIHLFFFVLALMLWLVNHPYQGIYHDAIVYSILAARKLAPEGFGRELFFIFGSQDDFSLYTPIFSAMVSVLGLDLASRLTVLLGGGLWILAFLWLGKVIFRDDLPWKFLVLLAAIICWSYSPNAATFQMSENFATSRVIAMPLGLMAIAAEIGGRRWHAVLLATLSFLLHPLMGVWPLILILTYRWPRLLLLLLAAFAFLLSLTLPLVFPVASLQVMGAEWADMVRYSSTDVFFKGLDELRTDRLLYCLLAFTIGFRHGQERLRPMYFLLGLMTLSTYLLSYYCSHYYPVAFIMQVQPWRVLWLAICFGLYAAADGFWRLILRGRQYLLMSVFLVILFYAFASFAHWLALLVTLCLLSDRIISQADRAVLWLAGRKFLLFALILLPILAMLPGYLIDLHMLGVGTMPKWWESTPWLRGFLFSAALGLVFWVVVAEVNGLRFLAWLVVLPLFFLALWNWDNRDPRFKNSERAFLAAERQVRPFQDWIRVGDVVAWPGNDMRVWLEIRTAVYASGYQAIGIVFSERKAIEVSRRLRRFAAASIIGDNPTLSEESALAAFRSKLLAQDKDVRNIHKYHNSEIKQAAIPYLCADPVLDWVVLDLKGGEDAAGKPVSVFTDRWGRWGLFQCLKYRSAR